MREAPPYYIYDKKLLISGKIVLRCAKRMQRYVEKLRYTYFQYLFCR